MNTSKGTAPPRLRISSFIHVMGAFYDGKARASARADAGYWILDPPAHPWRLYLFDRLGRSPVFSSLFPWGATLDIVCPGWAPKTWRFEIQTISRMAPPPHGAISQRISQWEVFNRSESRLRHAINPRRSDVPSLINVGNSNASCEPTPRAQSLSEGALTGNIDQRIGIITSGRCP